MPITNPQSNTNTVSALMNDPNTSKIIAGALDSPAGSTDREKAASMMRSMGANSTPPPAEGAGLLSPDTTGQAPTPSPVSSPASAYQQYNQELGDPTGLIPPKSTFMLPSTPARKEKGVTGLDAKGEYIPNEDRLRDIRVELGELGIPQDEWEDYVGKDPLDPSSNKLFYKKPTVKWEPKEGYEEIQDPEGIPQYDDVEKEPGTDKVWGKPTVEVDTEKYKANLDEDDLRGWEQIIQEAVDAGVGADTFTWQLREDRNKLNALAKFSGMPEEAMESFEGASLARQIGDLEKSLKEEYKVNSLQENLTKLQERGLSIEDDITDYMTARDQYVSRLDSMINATKQSMVTADMANPYVAKRMNNYINYLYVTKGRHQKRYADFVSDGINQHNLELTRAQNSFDSNYAKFTDALSSQTEIAKEDYDRFNTMIAEMYDNLDTSKEKEYELGILEEQWLNAQLDNAKLILDMEGDGQGQIDLSPGKERELEGWEERFDLRGWSNAMKNTLMTTMSKDQIGRFLRAWRDKEKEDQTEIDPMTYLDEWSRKEDLKKNESLADRLIRELEETSLGGKTE